MTTTTTNSYLDVSNDGRHPISHCPIHLDASNDGNSSGSIGDAS